ncbi:MAG TPA: ABC transporter permease [Woeseiaceae bacterium]|nr:ABC transporter permease [Woeseiaceae bacterium]
MLLNSLDLRHVLRGLRRTPVFTVVTLLTLALAIGANTAVFSLVDQTLLRSLPYPEPERLVAVWADWSKRGAQRDDYTNPADFADWREQSRTIEDMAAYEETSPALTGFGDPRLLAGAGVSHSFFDVLGIRLQIGRGFAAQEDVPNGPNVAVVSNAFWRGELKSDPGVLQQTLTLNGEPYSIIGVLPRGFSFPFMPDRDVWTLLQAEREGRGSAFLRVIGRLAPGADIESATADMSTIAARISSEFRETNEDIGIYVQPLKDAVVDGVRLRLLVLWAAVGFVLLVACVNIANLLLVRAAGRARELAIRGTLGARRGALMKLVVLESVLLSLGGTLLGLLFAELAISAMHSQLPGGITEYVAPVIDLRVLAVAVLAGLVTGIAFGLIPAFRAGGADPVGVLRGGERGGNTSISSRTRNVLVVANFALALALTVGAGLFARSLVKLEAVDPGFRADGVLTATITLPEASYGDADALRAFQHALDERLGALPGVRQAGLTHSLPLADLNTDASLFIEGRPTERRDGRAHMWYSIVTPGYLEALNIRPVQGRVFTEQDRNGSAGHIVVNAAFARQYFGGTDAVGQRVTPGDPGDGNWLTIIGVVDDVRFFGVDQRQTPAAYLPLYLYPQRLLFLALQAAGDPLLLAGPLRDAVAALDPTVAVDSVRPMTALVDASLQPARSTAALVGAFAAAALLIAVIGVYGTLSYAAAQRRREFGVRMALGASGGTVLSLVLRQGMLLALAGIGIGLALTALITRGFGALLYEVHPLDPLVFGGVAALLLAVALAATAIPAWRAGRTQPMRVLREE